MTRPFERVVGLLTSGDPVEALERLRERWELPAGTSFEVIHDPACPISRTRTPLPLSACRCTHVDAVLFHVPTTH